MPATESKPATFQWIAVAGFAVMWMTPRLMISVPGLVTIGCAIAALTRKEPRPALSVVLLLAALGLIALA